MGNTPFKMKGFSYPSPLRNEENKKKGELKKGKSISEIASEMTPEELKKAKINPKEGVKYYKNPKTGQMSTSTTVTQ
tara:strand:+ start:778 stop:1008 length:231 start_codon:yes stop_codon:yes gene_type:complete